MIPVTKENEKIKNLGRIHYITVPGAYGRIYYSSAGGNCKLCHISDIVYPLESTEENTIQRLNEIFSGGNKLCFEVNVSDIKTVETLNKYFKLVFCNKVPIGYKGAEYYTYFALFLTNNNFRSGGVTQESVLLKMKELEQDINDFDYKCQFKEKN